MKSDAPAILSSAKFEEFRRSMPIVCVDLLVTNHDNEILLVKRKNSPAKGQWWFPGGRVHINETRTDAAIRKLNEECGLKGKILSEVGTYDVIFDAGKRTVSHAVTTVYLMKAGKVDASLDSQSTGYAWKKKEGWLPLLRNGFVKTILAKSFPRNGR